MPAKVKTYLPALLCALAPVLCYLIVHPYAEMGIDDDWSYVKSAQVLAQTGHIVYNGWATAMLGWQLYFGALFVKLFGFSFTAVRLSTLVEAMATAFLLQRSMVRAGINEWNATLATTVFILSPAYLPLTFTFMTDVPGIFSIVLCLYMCLRALEAKSQNSALVWVVLAALLSAVGGTARQTAWLGVLVMVPSTLWLLRRDRRVLMTGALSCIAGAGIVFAATRWFARQPYSVPFPLIPGKLGLLPVTVLGSHAMVGSGELSMLLTPVLLMFIGPVQTWNRRRVAIFAAGSFCFALLGAVLFITKQLNKHLAPFLWSASYMMRPALQSLGLTAALGARPDIARDGPRLLLTAVTVIGFLGFLSYFLGRLRSRSAVQVHDATISWRKLGIVLGPFTIAYTVLLASNAYQSHFFERYLLPLFAICLLALTRYYQQNVKANLALACVFLIAIFAGFGIAGTHDEFSKYRGYVAAIGELRSSGVPATAIWGPWEFDGWTEVEKVGYFNDPRIRVPRGAYVPPPPRAFPLNCGVGIAYFLDWTPAVKPVYATSLEPDACEGQAAFPPAAYRAWIPPHNRLIYIVRLPASLSR